MFYLKKKKKKQQLLCKSSMLCKLQNRKIVKINDAQKTIWIFKSTNTKQCK